AHHFALSVARHGTLADLRTEADFGNVAEQHRDTDCRTADHGGSQVGQGTGLAETAQDELFVVVFEIPARSDRAVGRYRRDDVVERESETHQLIGSDDNLYLSHETAEGIDLRHPRDGAELRAHHPVVQGAQFSGI